MRKKASGEPKPKAEVQQCIDAYYESFVLRFNSAQEIDRVTGEPTGRTVGQAWMADREQAVSKSAVMLPIIHGGKHGKQIKTYIASWGFERMLDLCRSFCSSTHPRVLKSDYSIDAMLALGQFLMVQEQSPDARRAENLHAAARATGRA